MPKADFKVIDVVRDPDGVTAVITQNVHNGRVSFMLCREFEREGETQRSPYLNYRHVDGISRLLGSISARLVELEDKGRTELRVSRGRR